MNVKFKKKNLDANINVRNVRSVGLLKMFVVMICVGWLYVAQGGC